MTDIVQFLQQLRSLKVSLSVDGDRLRVNAPKGALTPEVRAELAARKAEVLDFLRQAAHTTQDSAPPIQPVPRDKPPMLSYAQERLWVLDQVEPGNTSLNLAESFRLRGSFDIDRLAQSLNTVVARHESLRTTFGVENGEPVQVIAPTLQLTIPVVDLRHLEPEARQAKANDLTTAESFTPFNLSTGPLIRAKVLRLSDDDHVLLLTTHHSVTDGWSVSLFWREFSEIYAALTEGRAPGLPDLPVQYPDYAHWQRNWLSGPMLKEQIDYWRRQLADAPPVLDFPTDFARPPVQSYRGRWQKATLPADLVHRLNGLARAHNATLFMVLLTAFKAILQKFSGQERIVVGTPMAGRPRPELESMIGFFLNSLVLHTDLSGQPTFVEALKRVRETTLGAYAHQDIPFEKLLTELHPERDPSRTPFFQVFFNMLSMPERSLELPGVQAESVRWSEEVDSKFDLTLYLREEPHAVDLTLVYNTDLFSAERMAEFLRQYRRVLEQIAADSAMPLADISLLTPEARRVLPNPRAPLADDWQGPVFGPLSAHAQSQPERTAVADAQTRWTYHTLEARSNQLAHRLLAAGAQKGDVAAVFGYRSVELVWAVLAVLKAGCAFTIIDPAYPPPRQLAYLQNAKPRVWLAVAQAGQPHTDVQAFLQNQSLLCSMELAADDAGLAADAPATPPDVSIGPDDLAYLAFTSGSTGQPKGVMGRHGPLSHFLPWQTEAFSLSTEDRFSMLSGLSHDPLQRDIFTPLWVGAALIIPPPEVVGAPGLLTRWMADTGITFAHLTPPMAQILVETAGESASLPALRHIFFVGDKLPAHLVASLQKLAPNVVCINSYGSTETQRAVAYNMIPRPSDDGASRPPKAIYPVGRGMPNVQLLILNARRQLAGIGEVGEIYVRSPHLAAGYLNDPALTAEKFIANPFTGTPADRLYRSGDLGRYRPDGTVEFGGRNDQQVKIRGFRIELAEVERALLRHPQVSEAAIVARPDDAGGNRLVAYAALTEPDALSAVELRQHMLAALPDYMAPAAFVLLEKLPLTPNAKIDYKALPQPDMSQLAASDSYVAPQGMLQRQLVRIWEEVLQVRPIGIHDNFFELGGHSLLAVRLFVEIEAVFGAKVPLMALFQAPTIEQLSHVIAAGAGLATTTSLVPIQPQGDRPPFFCVHGVGGHVLRYYDLAYHLGTDQPFYGLQSPGIEGEKPVLQRVEDMAAHYVEEILAVFPEGPYFIGGLSFGGYVAYEMARLLRGQGHQVGLVALFDTPLHYLPHFRDELSGVGQVGYAVHKWQEWMGHQLNKLKTQSPLAVWRDWRAHRAEVAVRDGRDNGLADEFVPDSLRMVRKINAQAMWDYAPKPYSGQVTLFKASESKGTYYGWHEFAAGVDTIEISGNHTSIVAEPEVERLAAVLRQKMDAALQTMAKSGRRGEL